MSALARTAPPRAQEAAAHGCEHYTHGAHCGAPARARYGTGWACDAHTPAALAGRTEVVPDPARTLDGLRAAAGIDVSQPMTPASPTVVDQRAVASGKRRSTPTAYREARAAAAGAR